MRNYYKDLEIPDFSTDAVVLKAYRKLAKKYHPDINPDDKSLDLKMKELNEAKEILFDRISKEHYDSQLQSFLIAKSDFDTVERAANSDYIFNRYNNTAPAEEELDEKSWGTIIILSWILLAIPGLLCCFYFLVTGQKRKMWQALFATGFGVACFLILSIIIKIIQYFTES